MHRARLISRVLVIGCLLMTGLPAHAGAPVTRGVVARVTASGATLDNGVVRRTWKVDGGRVLTTALVDVATRRNWAVGAGPDFRLTVDGVPTSSVDGWQLRSVVAQKQPVDRTRPAAKGGAQLVFRYVPDLLVGLELRRVVLLRPGSPVLEITSTLLGERPARVSSYSLDEVVTSSTGFTEVQAYHGGSDWRDDYRVSKRVAGSFDEEGEVARLDDGTGAGLFFVTERRSHVASRVGRDAQGRSWAGVDLARDLFDWGPLRTDPPDYNRLDNPVHPVPLRARLLRPGQELRLGRVFTGVYSHGAPEAAFAFAHHFASHVMPPFRRSIGLNTWHPWGRGDQLADANLRKQALLAKKLGVETFMLDDQWQGGDGGESGDWRFDEVRFPDKDRNGVPDFVTFLRQQGLRLGLWMSLANFHPSSHAFQQHPDWACAPTGLVSAQVPDDAGLGVWDISHPALRAHLVGVVDRAVRTWGATELKLDFQAWTDCGGRDYLDYEDAFLDLVRSLQARHPHVTFTLDETNDQRAWPFASAALGPSWFDNGHLHGSTKQAKLLHDLWSAAPWIPTSTIGMGFLDGTLGGPYTAGYLAPIGLLSHLTFWTDQAAIPVKDRAEVSWWLRWYAQHRADLSGAAYELTGQDPLDGRSPLALQPWTGERGVLFAFWQSSAKPLTVRLQGLDAKRTYRLSDARTGRVVRMGTGAALERGLTLTPKRAYTAQVLTIVPVR